MTPLTVYITSDVKTAYVFLPEDRQAIYQPDEAGVWNLVNYVDSLGLSISTHLAEDQNLLKRARKCFEDELAARRKSDAEHKARTSPKGYANMMREHVALGKERTALASQIRRERRAQL